MTNRQRTNEIDWEAIRRRLSKAATATASARLSPEAAKQVMANRACELAQVAAAPPPAAEVLELITFELGGEQFGLETTFVRAVIEPSDMAKVPGTPDFLIGVMNLRGEVLAVIDLHKVLGVDGPKRAERPWVVVLGTERAEFGIAADSMQQVLLLRIDELLEPAASGTRIRREYLRGVTREALAILDGATLLGDARLYIDEPDDY